MPQLLLRPLRSSFLGALAFVGAVVHPASANASSPFLVTPEPAAVETTAAYRYANMTNDEAIAELNRRGLPYVAVDPVPGVRAPIRLTGRLHGVLIHTALAANQRATSPFEILDARLALALDDFTVILEKHDIDEIEHFSMYRPNVPAKAKTAVPAKPQKEVTPAAPEPPASTVATDKPRAHKTPSKSDKPITSKVAARGKPHAPHAANPAPAKPPPAKTNAPATAPKKQSAGSNTKPVSPAPKTDTRRGHSTDKPIVKSGSNGLGKAGLGPKTSESAAEKSTKQKTSDDVEYASISDKPNEVATESTPEKESVSLAPASPAAAPMGTRHPGGLAIDVGKLRKKDGTWINVLTHFHGKIGDKACGADAPVPASAEARELRTLVCDAMSQYLFTYVLTPNYNAAHADHFHMEIKPGVKWFLVH